MRHGFLHFSVRQFLYDELERRGIVDRSRPALVEIANDLRAKGGASVIVERLVEEARVSGADACIESVRTVGEARALLACGATLLAVDADQEARFERVQGRNSATDQVGWEEFQADEAREMRA